MPNVLILRAPGTNCDQETAYAFQLAGAKSIEIQHVNRLLEVPEIMQKAQIFCVPGGFSFGDDIAAGRILASQIRNHLSDMFREFHGAGKLILGICNGFQVLLKSGLIFSDDEQGPKATLTWNRSGMYTDRWVHLKSDGDQCVFLKGIESMYLPIAHAEGRFVPREGQLDEMSKNGQLSLRYMGEDNPNGSTADVAGVCDSTGRVFGLMPHPERFLDAVQHPHWTRLYGANKLKSIVQAGDGLAIFQNAVNFFR